MTIRLSFRICLIPALLCAAPLCADETPAATPATAPAVQSAVPDAAQITERWRAYFQSLQNLRLWTYNAQMQLWEKDAKLPRAAPRLVSDIKIRFANASPWFYREMQVRESEKEAFQVVAMAYDGKKYQMAVQNPKPEMVDGHPARKLMLLAAKPFSDDPTTRTNFHLTLAMPFIFVSDEVTSVPFPTLQKAEFWADAQQRITKVTADNWEGHSGFAVTITPKTDAAGTNGDERIEVFLDEVSSLPLRVRNINNKTQEIIGEIKITQLRAGENGGPALPLRVEISGNGNQGKTGKIAGTGLIIVEPASVSMNAPIDSGRFTIPFASMEFVLDNEKIVYSSFAKAAPKTPAKTPAKTLPKTPAKRK